jgi:hypothetical protein
MFAEQVRLRMPVILSTIRRLGRAFPDALQPNTVL